MAATNSGTLANTPRRARSMATSRKKHSTLLSHDAEAGKVHVEARVFGQLLLYRRILVRLTAIGDQMQCLALGGFVIDHAQKPQPLDVGVALSTGR